jgi:hypothetical protein
MLGVLTGRTSVVRWSTDCPLGLARIDDHEALVVGLDFYLDSCHRDLVAQDVGGLGVETSDSPSSGGHLARAAR